MPEFLGLSKEEITIIASGIGALIGGILIAIRGNKKGKPTSAAIAGAIQASACSAGNLAPAITSLRADMDAIKEDMAAVRDIAVKLEDRSR